MCSNVIASLEINNFSVYIRDDLIDTDNVKEGIKIEPIYRSFHFPSLSLSLCRTPPQKTHTHMHVQKYAYENICIKPYLNEDQNTLLYLHLCIIYTISIVDSTI